MEHSTPTPLITKAGLKEWLKVSDRWVKDRLNDEEFVDQCVIDIAPPGSSRRTIRYDVARTAEYLGIELQPAFAAVTVPAQRTARAA